MNISLTQHLGDNAQYVDDDSAAAIESLPDSAWPALLTAANHELELEDDEPPTEMPGIDCTVAVTHQPLNDFEDARQNHWRECKYHEEILCDGHPAIYYNGVQAIRGQQRRNMIVIDLGDIRAIVTL